MKTAQWVAAIIIVIFIAIYFQSKPVDTTKQDLADCLSKAGDIYQGSANANTLTRDDGTRYWKSNEIKRDIQDKLESDRQFCLDLYKD